VGIFLEGEHSRGDYCLGRLVECRVKASPATTSSSITTHTPSGQRNCASWASQPQKSVTHLPCLGGRTTKSTKGHVVALKKKMFGKNVWGTILLIISRSKLYYTASGIITNVGRSPVHRTATYKIWR